jgi:hypothetical protein
MTVAILGTAVKAGKDAEGAGADQDRDERHADREAHGHHGAEGHARTTAATRMATISPPPPAGALA